MNKSKRTNPGGDLLGVRWKNRPMTAAEYLAFSKGLVRKLMQFDPLFSGLIISGSKPNQYQKIADDLGDFDEKVFNYMGDDRNTIKMTLDTTYWRGFRSSFSNKEEEKRDIKLTISCGNTSSTTDLVNINFPGKRHPKCQDYAYLCELMKLLVEHCQPDNGFMTYGHIIDMVKLEYETQISKKIKRNHTVTHTIGWLNYFTDPAVNQRLPDDIDREVLATGGTLFSLKRSIPSVDNEEDVAIAMRIRDALSQPDVIDPYWQSNQGADREGAG